MQNALNDKFKFFGIMIIICIFAIPAHEFGHFLGFALSGIEVIRITFNGVQTVNGASNLISASGGPLMSIILAIFGLVMLYKSDRYKNIWGSFSFIMCLTRLNTYFIILVISFFGKKKNLFSIQDEGFMSNFLNMPLWSFYIIFIALFTIIIYLIIKNLKSYYTKYISILGYSFLSFFVIMFLEVAV